MLTILFLWCMLIESDTTDITPSEAIYIVVIPHSRAQNSVIQNDLIVKAGKNTRSKYCF